MTNSNLIPVFNGLIANQPVQLCNARELHAFVESKRQYGDWIKDRISDYGFVQNEDYIIVTERTNGRPRKEYHITLDMGKELAMVERNEKGRQVRKYFIECERKALQQPQQLALPEPEKKYPFEHSEKELQNLAWDWFALFKCVEFTKDIVPALDAIQSKFAPQARSIVSEYGSMLRRHQPLIQKLTAQFEIETWGDENWNRVLPTIRDNEILNPRKRLPHRNF
ncbi:antA/AntB antirepressor family protein [Avibacterium paragallinarum]|uniref:Phage anti-repressor protein n=2 Tax=Avibacterium paragallinarum TaxID=728 RepID=A0A377I820_AVIPA|nr:antA/AntB antirepressor family protein [Avibacterium paragallinarum]POY47453.1 hypothetical protein C3364_01865 [Avibacterium paragallinarum]RZN75245.1 hypothetical protein EC523_09100 [Avibacterium paragallinarum]CDF99494.1 Putative Uncharacterized protein HI_1422 [Avibacterium paragallinarum JF4211]STO71333.1 phage anti-repressor protein [Avibacterium paragallinarum]